MDSKEETKVEMEVKEEAVTKPPMLSPIELKELFDKVKVVDDKECELSVKLEDLRQEKSVIIKAIHDGAGKGPFEYEGARFTIAARGDNYFFRQEKTRAVTKIS
jgi:predicted transcriptional regulator